MQNIAYITDSKQFLKDAVKTPVPGVSITFPHINDLLDLKPFTGNRLYRERVSKMIKFFKMAYPTHHIFGVVNILKKINFTLNNEDYSYEPGLELIDGNTRGEAMRLGKIDRPEHKVIAIVFDVDEADLLQGIYESYDSVSASKKTAEGIQSAIQTLGLNLNSRALSMGKWPTALNIAINGHGRDLSTLESVAYFKEELKFLDKSKVFDPEDTTMNNMIVKALALIVAKLYNRNDRCLEGLKRLGSFDSKGLLLTGQRWDGITAICYEYMFRNPSKSHFRLPAGYHCKTSFAMVDVQMDFLLYAFDKWMSDRPQDKTNGWKSNTWQGVYKETLDDMFSTYPI